MKATDIMEALTDMDDDVLMRAEIDPPQRYTIFLRGFQKAIAACLMCVVVITALIGTVAIATETGLRWRVRYREDEVTWLFKDGMEQEGELPNYEPTWLPEGYELSSDYWGPTQDRSIGYKNKNDDRSLIWFHYLQIADKDTFHLGSLDKGTYEMKSIEINGLPGELYTLVDEPDSGYLLWINKRSCIVFLLDFDSGAEDAIRIAESVTLIEEE